MNSSEPQKKWSVREWLSNFLEDQHPYYHGADGDDDYLDNALPEHDLPGAEEDYYDELDESLVDSLIIIGLAAALAFLVYYRQQRQVQGRNQERQGQSQADQLQEPDQPQEAQQPPLLPGQQPDGGFFPPPDDPNFGAWVAGGVGH